MPKHDIIQNAMRYRKSIDDRFVANHLRHVAEQSEPIEVSFGQLRIVCPAGVYHPDLGSSTLFFASQIARYDVAPGARILEIGSGSGLLSLWAKKRFVDVSVIGVDRDDRAVAASRRNAEINGLDVAFETSDLFDAVEGRFDLILFNPPLLDRPTDDANDLWIMSDPGGVVVDAFLRGLPDRLTENGAALLLQSNFGKTIMDFSIDPMTAEWVGAEITPSNTVRAIAKITAA